MKRLLPIVLLALALTGCATRWVVDSNVRSFSSLEAVPAQATYRFERLPSQQAGEASQQRLEAMAEAALERVGLRRDDADARYTAQVGASVTVVLSPWADPWFHGGGPWPYGPYWAGGGFWGPAFLPPADTWYAREVSIVLRELPSHRVVYETRARNDGPYATSRDVLPVMFQAALEGFPTPPTGERRVDIELRPAAAPPSPSPAPDATGDRR